MYTKEILKKRPDPPIRHPQWVGGYSPRPAIQRPQQQQHMRSERYMDKLPYAEYLKDVEKVLKRGDYVTLRGCGYRIGNLPAPTMKVRELQEICWMAPVDPMTNEPKCLVLEDQHGVVVPSLYSPRTLRKLNDEEMKLVHSRDSAAKGRQEALDASLRTAGEDGRIVIDTEDFGPAC